MIDIHLLPKKAQNELIDFYKFLIERYTAEKTKKQEDSYPEKERINHFFDNYNIDLTNFKFNRNELYDR